MVERCRDPHGILQLNRPGGAHGFDLCTDQRGSVDDIEALALDDLQRDGRFAIEPGRAGAIFEGQTDIGQLAKRDDPVAIHRNRQVVDIFDAIETRRDFDGDRPRLRFDLACGNQLVVVDHGVDQIGGGDVVGLERQRIDDDLQHLLPITGQASL